MKKIREDIITSDDILGKDAIDIDGDILGIVMKLHISKKDKKILGITIDQGFMKPDLYVGIEHIKNFGKDTIFLTRIHYEKYKGLEVISHNGERIGVVQDILLENNLLKKIIISKSIFTKKNEEIELKFIEEIGSRIILKNNYSIS
jgi:uncharacterized protein YrrD